jgi:hypothetical protein
MEEATGAAGRVDTTTSPPPEDEEWEEADDDDMEWEEGDDGGGGDGEEGGGDNDEDEDDEDLLRFLQGAEAAGGGLMVELEGGGKGKNKGGACMRARFGGCLMFALRCDAMYKLHRHPHFESFSYRSFQPQPPPPQYCLLPDEGAAGGKPGKAMARTAKELRRDFRIHTAHLALLLHR